MHEWIVSNTLVQLSFSTVFKVGMFPTLGILMHALFQRGLKINSGPDSLLMVSRVFKIILKGKGRGKGNAN